jgi:hypothetical protein
MAPPQHPSGARPAVEHRARLRQAPAGGLVCHLLMATDGCRWARVHNLSASGVGLLVSQHLEPGTLLMLELRNTRQRLTLVLVARVIHSTPQPDGSWLGGCVFAEKIDGADLQALMA